MDLEAEGQKEWMPRMDTKAVFEENLQVRVRRSVRAGREHVESQDYVVLCTALW